MNSNAVNQKAVLYCTLLILLATRPAHAFEWKNLWSTPAQRAQSQLEKQNYEALVEQAPNAQWRGLGEYRKGDYANAVNSFEQQRLDAEEAGLTSEVERAKYNKANAHTLNEEYADALSLLDDILQENPEHANAAHNKAIVEKLLEQQQQQQEQQQQDGSEQHQEQQPGDNDEQQQSEGQQQQEGDQQESQEQSGQQQNGESSDGNNESSEQNTASAEQKEQAEQDAEAASAMQAEQERAQSENNAGSENISEAQNGRDPAQASPLTEKEQANEQWLRQIPDDPAGLLQRKLQNRHLTDFPKVQNSAKPW